MSKKVTLENLAKQLEILAKQMAKGFAAVSKRIDKTDERLERYFTALAEDISKTASKEQIVSLHMQVNSIEVQLRGYGKLQTRVDNLEEKVFGAARG